MDLSAFLPQAWKTVARALAEAGVAADLDRHPELIRKSVKRRCMAELKRLTVMIRRLIFLMALGLELAPAMPRAGRNYFETENAPAPKRHAFRLVPLPAGACPYFLRGPEFVPLRGPAPAGPVIAKWAALLHALKHRQRRAKCLARTLARWRARREPKPYVPPMAHTHRMRADLGLIASALPMLLNRAFDRWPDTG